MRKYSKKSRSSLGRKWNTKPDSLSFCISPYLSTLTQLKSYRKTLTRTFHLFTLLNYSPSFYTAEIYLFLIPCRTLSFLNTLPQLHTILIQCRTIAHLNTWVADSSRDPGSIPYLKTWKFFPRPSDRTTLLLLTSQSESKKDFKKK